MKTLFITSVFILITFFGHSQVKIDFSSYDMWKNDTLTGKPELVSKINELGYFVLNKEKATVLVYNESSDKEVLFEFTSIEKDDYNGTYVGFGKIHPQQMILFNPESAFILFIDQYSVQSVFLLEESDVKNIAEGLKEDLISWDINEYRGEELKELVKENYPVGYSSILVLVQHKMVEFSKEHPLEPSEDYFKNEVSRQCFAFNMISSYIDSFGIDVYKEDVEKHISKHSVYINGEWYVDNFSLAFAVFRTNTND